MLDIFDHVFGRKRQSPKSEVENNSSETNDGGESEEYVHINLPVNGAAGKNPVNGVSQLPYPINFQHITPLTQPSPSSFSSSHVTMDDIPFSLHPSLKVDNACKDVGNDIAQCERKLEQIQELLAEDGYNFNLERSIVQ